MKNKKIIHKKVDIGYCRITVEELTAFKFIATFWDSEMELEEDRSVQEFETFGGAMERAFDFLITALERQAA
jgi:hypothetical protein